MAFGNMELLKQFVNRVRGKKKRKLNIGAIINEIKVNINDLSEARNGIVKDNITLMKQEEETRNTIDANTIKVNVADKMIKKLKSIIE